MANRGKRGPCPEIEGSPNFRSSYERNVYRVLRKIFSSVSYESKRFDFPTPYRRCLDYKPDFFVDDRIIEVKGWLDGRSKTKIMGFKKHFPEEFKKLIVITQGRDNIDWFLALGCEVWKYSDLKTNFKRLVHWD